MPETTRLLFADGGFSDPLIERSAMLDDGGRPNGQFIDDQVHVNEDGVRCLHQVVRNALIGTG